MYPASFALTLSLVCCQPQAAPPSQANRRADLLQVEGMVRQMQDQVKLTAAKLDPECMKLARTQGRYEALLSEFDHRLALVRQEAERHGKRHQSLKSLPDLDADIVAASEKSVAAVKEHEKRLSDDRTKAAERLAQIKQAYINKVIKGSLTLPAFDDDALLQQLHPQPAALEPPANAIPMSDSKLNCKKFAPRR